MWADAPPPEGVLPTIAGPAQGIIRDLLSSLDKDDASGAAEGAASAPASEPASAPAPAPAESGQTAPPAEAAEAPVIQPPPPPTPKPKRQSRLRELEQARSDIYEKELELLRKEALLMEQEETLESLRQQLELERNLVSLLEKDKKKAEEIAALATGLCSGAAMPP